MQQKTHISLVPSQINNVQQQISIICVQKMVTGSSNGCLSRSAGFLQFVMQ